MTNLPNSEQTGNLDNLAVTRAEFRSEIGILLEYVAQALGPVSGTYTTEVVDPLAVELGGAPVLEIGADPVTTENSLRIPSTQWVKKSGRYVSSTAPTNPVNGTLWIDTNTTPYAIKAYNGVSWDGIGGVASGTRMLFQQTAAPVGWTKITTSNNTALRVTSGSVQTGGVLDFTAAFASSIATSGTVAGHTLTVSQMPSHGHGVSDPGHAHAVSDPGHAHSFAGVRVQNNEGQDGNNDTEAYDQNRSTNPNVTGIGIFPNITGITVAANGGNAAHAHGYTGNPIALNVKYVDVIIAQKA